MEKIEKAKEVGKTGSRKVRKKIAGNTQNSEELGVAQSFFAALCGERILRFQKFKVSHRNHRTHRRNHRTFFSVFFCVFRAFRELKYYSKSLTEIKYIAVLLRLGGFAVKEF